MKTNRMSLMPSNRGFYLTRAVGEEKRYDLRMDHDEYWREVNAVADHLILAYSTKLTDMSEEGLLDWLGDFSKNHRFMKSEGLMMDAFRYSANKEAASYGMSWEDKDSFEDVLRDYASLAFKWDILELAEARGLVGHKQEVTA